MGMNQDAIQGLAETMRRETALFELILNEEEAMTQAIRERNWVSLEASIRSIDVVERELNSLESHREGLFLGLKQELGLGSEATFYQWAVNLPRDLRDELTETYRRLKYQALNARASGAVIANYISESQTVLSGIMEELFPQRRDVTYDKRGTRKQGQLHSIVLDKAL